MSPSFSTKVLLFSGLSLLQISKNFVDLAQHVSALALTRRTGVSKCNEALVLESFQENPSDSEQNSEDLQQKHDPAEAGAGNANSPSVCETTELATGRTCSNLNEAGMPKVLKFMNTANLLHRERAYLLRKKLLIDLSLNFVDAERLSVPEGGQDAAFEIADDGAQETSAASTLVRAQRWKTVGDLKTWLASVRGKSKFFIDVFLSGTENHLQDTQTLSQIGEASNNTGPVNLFVLERVFNKDALVQDFLEQYSTRLKNFTEIESSTADAVVQKNELTVRIDRDVIETNTKTSSENNDSSPFYEITFVRERGPVIDDNDGSTSIEEWLYIVFRGSTNPCMYYDVSGDWWLTTSYDVSDALPIGYSNEDFSFNNNIRFHAETKTGDRKLKVPDLGEMTWAKLFTTFLIYGSFESTRSYPGHVLFNASRYCFDFPDHVKQLLIPEWRDFAIEFHNESAGAPSLGRQPIPDSQRLITKTDAGDVKIYGSDREYFEEVEKIVGGNWNGLRIADVTFKQTQVFKQS